MLLRRLIRRWFFPNFPLSVPPVPPGGGAEQPAVLPWRTGAAAVTDAAAAAAAAAAAKPPQSSALHLSPSATVRGAHVKACAAVTGRVVQPWVPIPSNFCRGLGSQTDIAIAASAQPQTATIAASDSPACIKAVSFEGHPGLAGDGQNADAAYLEPAAGLVEVDIKRDQKRFLRMLGPLREAVLARIAACASKEEAKALKDYYSRVIDYNCTGGKLLRGLLTVYASLAANREVQFAQPAESGAATAASAAAAALPSVFHLATAHAGGGAAPVYTGAATASAGAAAVEEAFNSGACVLGWGVELLQAAFLVADDQMDGAYTRRGKICWYRRQEVGPANAINDAVFLIFSIHQVLRQFLGKHPSFSACSDLLQDVAFNTVQGQHLDSNGGIYALLQPCHQQQQRQQQEELLRVLREGTTAAEATLQQLTAAARCRQQATARLKTSYYSFWLPTALGLLYSGVSDQSLLAKAEEICLCTGDYFQAQDDFLDCFGCPDALGKTGTDIREGKCSWLLVEALAAATPAEAAELLEAYGRPGREDTVRELYVHLKAEERFKDYESGVCEKILRLVERLGHPGLQSYFVVLLQLLHRRPQ